MRVIFHWHQRVFCRPNCVISLYWILGHVRGIAYFKVFGGLWWYQMNVWWYERIDTSLCIITVWSSQESDTCTIEHSRVHLPCEYFKSSCSGVLLPKTQIFVPFFTEQEGPPTPKPRPKHAGGCPKHVDAPHSLLPLLAQHPKLRLVFWASSAVDAFGGQKGRRFPSFSELAILKWEHFSMPNDLQVSIVKIHLLNVCIIYVHDSVASNGAPCFTEMISFHVNRQQLLRTLWLRYCPPLLVTVTFFGLLHFF